MKSIKLIPLLLIAYYSSAQNYQTVRSDRISLFKASNSEEMRAIRIDSIIMNGNDSVLHLFNTIRAVDYMCYDPFGYSWIGKSVTIKPDGRNIFLNKDLIPIQINTLAAHGSSWICHTEQNGNYVRAHVESITTETFLSVTDTVKTIRFTYFTPNHQVINAGVHNKSIKISKNFGLVQALPFYVFPNLDIYGAFCEDNVEYHLHGIDNEIGISNFGYKEIFDFQPGDEFHIYTYRREGIHPNMIMQIRREIQTILQRIEYADDSIEYIVSRCGVYYDSQANPNNTTYHDTVSQIYRLNDEAQNILFRRLPQETYFVPGVHYTTYDQPAYLFMVTGINQRYSKIFMDYHAELLTYMYDCWMYPIYDGIIIRPSYTIGLGGPYYYGSFFYLQILERSLVYYKKGDETWGTPYNCDWLLHIETLQKDDQFQIEYFPNPAKDYIIVRSQVYPAQLRIFDMTGRLLKELTLMEQETTVDISRLSKGAYLAQIQSHNYLSRSRKIIKH